MTKLRGLYLVVSPETSPSLVEEALRGGGDLLQIWMGERVDRPWAEEIRALTRRHQVPLLVNNDVGLAKEVGADGVHMDGDQQEPKDLRRELGREAIVGITCSTDFHRVLWAAEHGADYISFCSVFPSPSVDVCDLVPFDLIRRAKQHVKIPVFASGGITLENVREVLDTGVDGIAVISAIFRAPDPQDAARRFKTALLERVVL